MVTHHFQQKGKGRQITVPPIQNGKPESLIVHSAPSPEKRMAERPMLSSPVTMCRVCKRPNERLLEPQPQLESLGGPEQQNEFWGNDPTQTGQRSRDQSGWTSVSTSFLVNHQHFPIGPNSVYLNEGLWLNYGPEVFLFHLSTSTFQYNATYVSL